ncbi:ATP-binding protein [bacterium]|nr:ATP-binding protein [bacterium]
MLKTYRDEDYEWIKELMLYPRSLEDRLGFFKDTSEITIPDDPIDKVVFQDKAKDAIRKIAQNKGHMLMVGKPGTGKSMLVGMFSHVLDKSLGDYIRPKKSIVAYPGKDDNNMRIAYADSEKLDSYISELRQEVENAKNSVEEFSLEKQIQIVKKAKTFFISLAILSIVAGIYFPQAFILTGLMGIGAIFMFI